MAVDTSAFNLLRGAPQVDPSMLRPQLQRLGATPSMARVSPADTSAIGSVAMLDVPGAIARGQEFRAVADERERANALRSFVSEHGANLLRGDPEALAAYAAIDADGAMDLQSSLLSQRNTQQAMEFARQDQGFQIEDRTAAQQAAEQAAQEAETQRLMSAAGEAYRRGDAESFARIFAEAGAPPIPMERFPEFAAFAGLDAQSFAPEPPPEPVLRDVDGTLYDVTDPANPVVVVADQPEPVEPVLRDVGGTLYDVTDPANPVPVVEAPPEPGWRKATPEEAASYGAVGGQINEATNEFKPINPPSGMAMRTLPDGTAEIVQGPGAASAFTEGQSKNVIYATRARDALATLEETGAEALTGRYDRAMGSIWNPLNWGGMGVGRSLQSPQFQVADQAGQNFLAAILRKDTGAAITAEEMEQYGVIFLPMPGNGPELLEAKRQAREQAVRAIEAGMSPGEIEAMGRALLQGGSPAAPVVSPPPAAAPATGAATMSDEDFLRSLGIEP